MFGINKKKEAEKSVTPVEEKGAGDEIQFDFEEDDKLPFDEDEGFDEDELPGEEIASGGGRQALPKRTVLLLGLLLLLALGGGGYYYLNSTPEPPPSPPAPVKTTVKVQAAEPAPAPAASPAPVAALPAKSPQPSVVAKAQTPPPAKTTVAPAKTTVPVAAIVTPAVKGEVVTAPTTRQPFTLSAGAFISQKHQRDIEKKIRRLGYTPKVQTTYSTVPMTRLLLGVFDPMAAKARTKELAPQVSDLFALKQGDKVALYAGSYQDLDQARSFADQLYLRGIHVDEETVSLRLPLKQISYGAFASRAAAEKAAKRAVAAGLTAQVVKR